MVNLSNLALSLPLLALNFGLLAFQVSAAPAGAGSDISPSPGPERTWHLYRESDSESTTSPASTAPAHFARQDDDSWVHCSDDSKFKVLAEDVKACKKLLLAADITDQPTCIHEVKDVPLSDGHTASYIEYIAMNSALIIPWWDVNPAAIPGFNENYGNCHQVGNVIDSILKKCTDPDGMVAGWTFTLGPTNSQAGVKIVKSAARIEMPVWSGWGGKA